MWVLGNPSEASESMLELSLEKNQLDFPIFWRLSFLTSFWVAPTCFAVGFLDSLFTPSSSPSILFSHGSLGQFEVKAIEEGVADCQFISSFLPLPLTLQAHHTVFFSLAALCPVPSLPFS